MLSVVVFLYKLRVMQCAILSLDNKISFFVCVIGFYCCADCVKASRGSKEMRKYTALCNLILDSATMILKCMCGKDFTGESCPVKLFLHTDNTVLNIFEQYLWTVLTRHNKIE